MKKILLIVLSFCLLTLLTGCDFTITTSKEEADAFGGFLEWLGFKQCDGDC